MNEGNFIDIEQYNKEIEEAMARIEAGEYYTHVQVVEMSKGSSSPSLRGRVHSPVRSEAEAISQTTISNLH
ncbi:MAG TPA: hypothetical protein VGD35_20540 [Chitinophaga sp.]